MIITLLRENENMHGFTLLELLIAVSILAIGLLAAATMQGVAMNANMCAQRITVATMVVQQVAEDLSSIKGSDPLFHTSKTNVAYNRMFDPTTNASTASIMSIPGAGLFSAEYDIAPNTPVPGTTQIIVRIFCHGSTTPLVTCSTSKMVI